MLDRDEPGLSLLGADALGVVVGGTAVALGHSYPKGTTALRSYCTRCGMMTFRVYEHAWLGARRESSTEATILTRVLALPPKDHEHAWVEPWAHVFPTYASESAPEPGTPEAWRNSVLQTRLRELDVLAESLHAIAVLDAAMQQDAERTREFVVRLLDFERHYPIGVV